MWASVLQPFTLIKIPFNFAGTTNDPEAKFFIVLGHNMDAALCLKPTATTRYFDSNPDVLKGCLEYQAGTFTYFRKRTIISPDDQFTIKHYNLTVYKSRGSLQVFEAMPTDFEALLKSAISQSETLDRRKKNWLGDALNCSFL